MAVIFNVQRTKCLERRIVFETQSLQTKAGKKLHIVTVLQFCYIHNYDEMAANETVIVIYFYWTKLFSKTFLLFNY